MKHVYEDYDIKCNLKLNRNRYQWSPQSITFNETPWIEGKSKFESLMTMIYDIEIISKVQWWKKEKGQTKCLPT